MSDKIYIRDLHIRTIIGVYDWERHKKQDIFLNLCLHTCLKKAGHSDCIIDTVDYKELTDQLIQVAESSSFQLIEALAETVATTVLDHPSIAHVDVTIDKPNALSFAKSVGVTISRP